MKKFRIIMIVLLSLVLAGCSNINNEQLEDNSAATKQQAQEDNGAAAEQQAERENQSTQDTDISKEIEAPAATDNIVDYSEYFQGISGCAVIYDESSNTYSFYNKEKCETEVSPLSTFKIVSALAGLENDVLVNEASAMKYSGAEYPVDTWNADLTLKEAFETSCIWYFRQVVDMVGQENIRTMLKEIQYGNCDISEWNGSGINPLPELNGFWLESSLKITPQQQVAVLNYLFGRENHFHAENLEELKNIMYIAELGNASLYGKTGSGTDGNAWFVGFIEENGNRNYFAVYLEDIQNKETVSGNKAQEIAIDILSNEVLHIKNADNSSDGDLAVNSGYDPSWTEEEMIAAINERSPYYKASAYYSEIIDYWENVREVRDISNVLEPLFETDKRYYTKEELENEPMLVIHLAKNEIYARHGYIFTNEDLYNYFMGCIWYVPTCDSADFDDDVLNEYEKANLEILADLDLY